MDDLANDLANDLARREKELEVARRHQITAWEVHHMVRLICFGPEAVDNPCYDLHEELALDRSRLEAKGSPIPEPELIAIWRRGHTAWAAACERETDPAKRAEMLAKLTEREAAMAAIRKRFGLTPELSEEGKLRMRGFRGFAKMARRAGCG
jgi:hypothetical protein